MGAWHKLRLSLGLTKPKVCVLVLGQPGAGKSSCLGHFRSVKSSSEPNADAACCAHTLRVLGRAGGVRKLVAVDFRSAGESGAEEERRRARFFGFAQGVLWLLDASQPAKLQEAQDVLDRTFAHPDLAAVPLFLVVNRCDAPGALSVEQVKEMLCLECLSGAARPWCIAPANAKTGEGLSEALGWLLQHAVQRGAQEEAESVGVTAMTMGQGKGQVVVDLWYGAWALDLN